MPGSGRVKCPRSKRGIGVGRELERERGKGMKGMVLVEVYGDIPGIGISDDVSSMVYDAWATTVLG